MLQLRPNQIEAFRAAALQRYESELVDHCREFAPRLAAVLGTPGLRVAVRQAMARARGHGFTFKGPTRLFTEATLLFGSDFDTDPQYPMFADAIAGKRDQMWRADRLFERISKYVKEVAGPQGEHEKQALHRLALSCGHPLYVDDTDPQLLIALLTEAFPEKAHYLGADPVAALIAVATAESSRAGLPQSRGPALVSALMFWFGHGCLNDPLYPWIGATWRDERIRDGEALMIRLEKKARTWLEHVLATSEQQQ